MVISTMGIMLHAKVFPFYNVLWECIVHVKYTVYKYFDRSVHIKSLDPT